MSNIIKAPKLPSQPIPIRQPNITQWIPKPLKATCGCSDIEPQNHVYIESKATGGVYCDMVCLCDSEGIEYSAEHRELIKDYYEVISYG